jgi:hypothetical protein
MEARQNFEKAKIEANDKLRQVRKPTVPPLRQRWCRPQNLQDLQKAYENQKVKRDDAAGN